jgi:hypothetical protein
MVAPVHKNTNALLILKIRDIHFFLGEGGKLHNWQFLGYIEGPRPFNCPSLCSGKFWGFWPLEISLEMAHYNNYNL